MEKFLGAIALLGAIMYAHQLLKMLYLPDEPLNKSAVATAYIYTIIVLGSGSIAILLL